MQQRSPWIGDIRGRGLMVGIELVRNQHTKERAEAERDDIVREAFTRGLLLLPCGRNSIRISPPLNITRDEIDEGLKVLEGVLIREKGLSQGKKVGRVK